MKKDKLIEYLKGQKYANPGLEPVAENNSYHVPEYKRGFNCAVEFALSKIDQLDEPELPVIPQFVALMIEKTKENRKDVTILNIFNEVTTNGFYTERVDDWIETDPETFVRAWLDGYTIEPQPIKTRQVLVKFFDNEEYKTELTEDAAKELIEFLEANKNE